MKDQKGPKDQQDQKFKGSKGDSVPLNRSDEEYEQYVARMKARTKEFARRVVRLVLAMQKAKLPFVFCDQLLRSGTGVGANYRAACRVRTGPEFTNKIRVVLEETDESQFWLELLIEESLMPPRLLAPLHAEATELVAICTSAFANSQRNRRR